MGRPLKREKNHTRQMILRSASKLFIEKGYSETRIRDIAADSKVQYSEVFRIFGDKDRILSELVGLVIDYQFVTTENVLKNITNDKLLHYAFETVLQLYVAESLEHIREMYAVSYSLPHSSKVIYRTITSKLEEVFRDSHPDLDTKDFYELEIATAGIMRGFITVPCDMYFTMERKIHRFLETTLKIYDVSQDKLNEVLEFVHKFNFQDIANELLRNLFNYLKSRT